MKKLILTILTIMSAQISHAYTATIEVGESMRFEKMVGNFDGSISIFKPQLALDGEFYPLADRDIEATIACRLFSRNNSQMNFLSYEYNHTDDKYLYFNNNVPFLDHRSDVIAILRCKQGASAASSRSNSSSNSNSGINSIFGR